MGFVLAAAVAVRLDWTIAVIGAGFSFATLAGYVYSLVVTNGLFQFHEPGSPASSPAAAGSATCPRAERLFTSVRGG